MSDTPGFSHHTIDRSNEEHGLSSREANILAGMVAATERRTDRLEDELPGYIKEAVEAAVNGRFMSDDERTWVRLAIQREAQSIKLRQAVIEKTLTALLWVILSGGAAVAWAGIQEWAKNHGYKP